MATNYSSYTEVPWYRRNAFALLLGTLFTPPLLYILLTGDIYYQRRGELRTYSKLAKGFLILWSAAAIIGMAGALADKNMLQGFFDMRPKEDRFMEQMQGVWKTAHANYACLWEQTDPRLICRTNEPGIMPLFEIRPNGKLDTSNHSMPVKYVMEKMTREQVAMYVVSAQFAAAFGSDLNPGNMITEAVDKQAQWVKSKNWAVLLKEVAPIPVDFYDSLLDSIVPCFEKAIEAGAPVGKFRLPDITGVTGPLYTRRDPTTCPKLLEYLAAYPPKRVIGALTPQMATALVTLRNVAPKPDEKFLPELIPDTGEALEPSFVRQLNDSEIADMPREMAAETGRRKSFAAIGPEFTAFWEAKLVADLRKVVDVDRIRAGKAAAIAANVERTTTEAEPPKQAE